MGKKLLYIITFIFVTGTARAQLQFEQTALQMGQVEWYTENNVEVTVTNNFGKPVNIKEILTSSSQISVQWDKKAIPAGEKSRLQIKYKADLLGHFEKAIYVYTDAQEKPYVLKATGDVVQQKDDYTGEYPYKVGPISLSTDNIEFDDVNRGECPAQVIAVRNGSNKVYHPELMHLPPYLSQRAEPDKLLPGRVGKIVVTLNTKAIESFGLIQTTVYVSRYPGDRVGKDNELEVSSVLLPPFDTTSVVQTALAPCLKIEGTQGTELRLPSIEGKSKVKGTILLKNIGKSSLEIRSLQVFNPAVNVDLGQMKIGPNRTERLKISVLSKYMNKSRSRLRVLMITNDPKQPKVIFNVILSKNRLTK
ncbi:MAG: DUF1573 domain-containing protein [Bacteroidaceae bacterium]